MPDIIIEQSQEVIDYINLLKLPISGVLKNHIVNMVSGIITTEGNKNISNDSLSKKDNSTKKIEGLDFHHSHSHHCVVTSHYKISEYSLPLNFKLYLKKQFFGQKVKKLGIHQEN
ncbi:hypothetical protein JCM21531_4650 [Acetivibrio straminisolvens JCM 21531]|uniref:Uncharacterized protein n=1 Tax=Acetivibrio straminisolvens JCM 21531 TaxID=1294263 RepID=W4VCQ5_9FIRM|nr:hypothetical protein JCM21531_4650 [Acetivibrio straminisolvens JCM 21531]